MYVYVVKINSYYFAYVLALNSILKYSDVY